MNDVGYCACGCGEKTKFYKHKRKGIPSGGGYARFKAGHHTRVANPHPNRKLSDEDVRKIRKMLLDRRYTQKMIARRYGVSEDTIWMINTRRIWKDL